MVGGCELWPWLDAAGMLCCFILPTVILWRADVCSFPSLVPRASHCPVLIACSMHKNRGRMPGNILSRE